MSTFATDMAQLRAKGMQCYGIGPAVDLEDGPKGFGMHSDQERLLESRALSVRAVQLRSDYGPGTHSIATRRRKLTFALT